MLRRLKRVANTHAYIMMAFTSTSLHTYTKILYRGQVYPEITYYIVGTISKSSDMGSRLRLHFILCKYRATVDLFNFEFHKALQQFSIIYIMYCIVFLFSGFFCILVAFFFLWRTFRAMLELSENTLLSIFFQIFDCFY